MAPRNKSMRRRIAVSILAAVLLVGLYSMIFSFSGQDGEESGSISRYVSEKCVEVANTLVGNKWTKVFKDSLAEYLEHPIRKLAHFSEYACMGILVYTLLRQWRAGNKKTYLLVALWVCLSAMGDEFHQTFVPGRSGNPFDVCLDTCGGCFGIFLSVITEKCIPRLKR